MVVYLQPPVFVLQEMLAIRCVAGDVCGGRSRLRSLHQRVFVSSGPPVGLRFFAPGPRPSGSGAMLKLRTRLCVSLLLGGSLMGAWWFVHQEKKQKLRRQRVEQLRQVAVGQGNFHLLDHRYEVLYTAARVISRWG